jgi:hypothetical protein
VTDLNLSGEERFKRYCNFTNSGDNIHGLQLDEQNGVYKLVLKELTIGSDQVNFVREVEMDPNDFSFNFLVSLDIAESKGLQKRKFCLPLPSARKKQKRGFFVKISDILSI